MAAETPKDEREFIPSYNNMLENLMLSTIRYSSAYRWILYLGFKYDKNKRSYYTDGHEREVVVRDRNDRILINYFKAELQYYHWVQVTDTISKLS